jgi:UDPglucose--hexose-1-phosphate uridylyltransferase
VDSSVLRRGLEQTSTRLADGRELIYFDESPRDRSAIDGRNLQSLEQLSELRYDCARNEWVVIASHRQGRTFLPPEGDCPLCPSTAAHATEIPAREYDVVVFENRFPSLAAGHGRCEVVCFTPQHEQAFAQLAPQRVATILEVWSERARALMALPEVEYVFVFENRGKEIGVTLSHPHGQIYAYPFVPPRVLETVEAARKHHQETGRCLFCDLLSEEEAGPRVIAQSSRWLAFVPYAARWPFEIRLQPRRHVADLAALDEDERREFPAIYLEILRRLDAVFGVAMPYIASWEQAPVTVGRELMHLSLTVFSTRRGPDKLKYLAGSESAAGVFVNDIVPERAAEMLRETKERTVHG